MSKTSSKVKQKYNEKAYDRLAITVKKGQREQLKEYAEEKGKSLNQLIIDLVKEDMKKNGRELK